MSSTEIKLYQVQTAYYVAGFEVLSNKIIRAAPIIKWIESYTFSDFEKYCARNRIHLHEIIQKNN